MSTLYPRYTGRAGLPPLKLTLPAAAAIARATDLLDMHAHVLDPGYNLVRVINVAPILMAGSYTPGHTDFKLVYEDGDLAVKIVHDNANALPCDRTFVYLLGAYATETLLVARVASNLLDPPRLIVEHIYPDARDLHLAIANALDQDELQATDWGDLLGEHPEYRNTVPGVLRTATLRYWMHVVDYTASVCDTSPEPLGE